MDLLDRIRNAKPGETFVLNPGEGLPTVLVKRTGIGLRGQSYVIPVAGAFDAVREKLAAADGGWVDFTRCEAYVDRERISVCAADVSMLQALPDFERTVRPGD